MLAFHFLFGFLRLFFSNTAALFAENLALRRQLAVLQRRVRRPRLRNRDRVFWAWLSRLWKGWRFVLVIVQPDTVVRWHQAGFRLYWRWKSRTTAGRPRNGLIMRDLIREMSRHNPTWGAPRIRSELRLLGYEVAKSTVARYMVKSKKPPSPIGTPERREPPVSLVGVIDRRPPCAPASVFHLLVPLRAAQVSERKRPTGGGEHHARTYPRRFSRGTEFSGGQLILESQLSAQQPRQRRDQRQPPPS